MRRRPAPMRRRMTRGKPTTCTNAFQFTEDGGVGDASRDVIARAG
jgi:hypothetical protein